MNMETLSEALGCMDLKYVDEALNYSCTRTKKRRIALKLLAGAACLVLAVYAGARAFAPQAVPEPTPDANLPVLELDTAWLTDGQGAFVLRMRDFSEYSFGSPWSADTGLAALPVFANPVEYAPVEQNRAALSWDEAAMRERLLGLAASLGMDAGEDDIVCSLDTDGALWSPRAWSSRHRSSCPSNSASLPRARAMRPRASISQNITPPSSALRIPAGPSRAGTIITTARRKTTACASTRPAKTRRKAS